MNKALTPEEAKNLTFPCLLEVWDFKNRGTYHAIITHITEMGHFETTKGVCWQNAALPSPEITEAMRKQFGTQSEYPKWMLVWDDEESKAKLRIVLADLGKKVNRRYITVVGGDECEFENGEEFSWSCYKNAKLLPEPDPISQEIAELRKRLADLEAKHNQQSK